MYRGANLTFNSAVTCASAKHGAITSRPKFGLLEEQMKTSILSLTLGIVLAGPVAAYSAERPARPFHSHRTIHYSHRTIHYRPVVRYFDPFAWPTAAATAAAPVVGWRPSHDPFMPRTTDGLSSNPNACVNYGCVDAGGGGD